MSKISGQCNCGDIKVTIPKDSAQALCHCVNCRRQSGSTASGNFIVKKKDFDLTGSPKVYKTQGSSGGAASRHFCGTCGSGIYTAVEAGDPSFVKAGLFEPGDIPAPSMELFCQNMESWEKVHDEAERKDTQ